MEIIFNTVPLLVIWIFLSPLSIALFGVLNYFPYRITKSKASLIILVLCVFLMIISDLGQDIIFKSDTQGFHFGIAFLAWGTYLLTIILTIGNYVYLLLKKLFGDKLHLSPRELLNY